MVIPVLETCYWCCAHLVAFFADRSPLVALTDGDCGGILQRVPCFSGFFLFTTGITNPDFVGSGRDPASCISSRLHGRYPTEIPDLSAFHSQIDLPPVPRKVAEVRNPFETSSPESPSMRGVGAKSRSIKWEIYPIRLGRFRVVNLGFFVHLQLLAVGMTIPLSLFGDKKVELLSV